MKKFWLCFVPLFVAVDILGVLPIFMGLTEGLDSSKIRRIILQSVITATAVALIFLAIGKAALNLLGITIADFMIAGGTLLFALSLRDMMTFEKQLRIEYSETLGVVPLGVPMIVGPGVLVTTMLLIDEYGAIPTVSAAVINIIIAGFVLWFSEPINRLLGKSGTIAISKLASLVLAAIGVMMVRKGIMIYIGS